MSSMEGIDNSWLDEDGAGADVGHEDNVVDDVNLDMEISIESIVRTSTVNVQCENSVRRYKIEDNKFILLTDRNPYSGIYPHNTSLRAHRPNH